MGAEPCLLFVCILHSSNSHMGMEPQLKVSSDRLKKPQLKLATPGFHGEWLIHNIIAALVSLL